MLNGDSNLYDNRPYQPSDVILNKIVAHTYKCDNNTSPLPKDIM